MINKVVFTNIHLPRLTVQISIEQRFKSTTVNQAPSIGGYAILDVMAESGQCPIRQSLKLKIRPKKRTVILFYS